MFTKLKGIINYLPYVVIVFFTCNAVSLADGGISKISLGENYACSIQNILPQRVSCWGDNGSGQLGNVTYTTISEPLYIQDIHDGITDSGTLDGYSVLSIATGAGHTCAINSILYLYCWGFNGYGQVGNASEANQFSPVRIGSIGGETVLSISLGHSHTCAINAAQQLYCWGLNASGQLGINESASCMPVPIPVYNSTTFGQDGKIDGKYVRSVSTGANHTCAITIEEDDDEEEGGLLYCWGNNSDGNLNIGNLHNQTYPMIIYGDGKQGGKLGGYRVIDVAAGSTHTCAINSIGDLYCWGKGSYGQLGLGTELETSAPRIVSYFKENEETLSKVKTYSDHTCVLNNSKTKLYCFGKNNYGQIDNSTTNPVFTPTLLFEEKVPILDFSLGENTTCLIRYDHTLMCYGRSIPPSDDECPDDDDKTEPGKCGCGKIDPTSADDIAKLGQTCTVGTGACLNTGQWQCDGIGGIKCSVSALEALYRDDVLCNNIDDDCDGETDEDFNNKGNDCTVGLGACEVTGKYVCAADYSKIVCNATAGSPQTITCANLDNSKDLNCDGKYDSESDIAGYAVTCNDAPSQGVGVCATTQGSKQCVGTSLSCVNNFSDTGDTSKKTTEICGNGIDEDCDGTDLACSGCQNDTTHAEGEACDNGETGSCQITGFYKCPNNNPNSIRVCTAAGTIKACCSSSDFAKIGNACEVGQGACTATGTFQCSGSEKTSAVKCNAVEGTPKTEICGNGIDEDCDGQDLVCEVLSGCGSDPNFAKLGKSCTINVGTSCESSNGKFTCPDSNPKSKIVCSSTAPSCCAETDFSKLGTSCQVGLGECRSTGQYSCVENKVICKAEKLTPQLELCDGLDNDCDGQTDEDFPELNTTCFATLGTCQSEGQFICSSDKSTTICDVPLCKDIDNNSVPDEYEKGDETVTPKTEVLPPYVEEATPRQVKIYMEAFDKAALSENTQQKWKTTYKYELIIKKISNRTKTTYATTYTSKASNTQRIITKRNKVTLRHQKAGTYTSKNRVIITSTKGKKTIIKKTAYSATTTYIVKKK